MGWGSHSPILNPQVSKNQISEWRNHPGKLHLQLPGSASPAISILLNQEVAAIFPQSLWTCFALTPRLIAIMSRFISSLSWNKPNFHHCIWKFCFSGLARKVWVSFGCTGCCQTPEFSEVLWFLSCYSAHHSRDFWRIKCSGKHMISKKKKSTLGP